MNLIKPLGTVYVSTRLSPNFNDSWEFAGLTQSEKDMVRKCRDRLHVSYDVTVDISTTGETKMAKCLVTKEVTECTIFKVWEVEFIRFAECSTF